MDELDTFKTDIDLIDFACDRGYAVDPRESSRNSTVLRSTTSDDKLIVNRRGGRWTYFSVRDDHDHGTIIDFLQRRGTPNLGELRKVLRAWLGRPEHLIAVLPTRITTTPVDRSAALAAYARAHHRTNSPYLNSRGIRPETLADPRFLRTWREDHRNNVLFPHADAAGFAGFEVKNRGWTGYSGGGVKALWRSRQLDTDCRAVFAESAIDALSFHQLHPTPDTRYYSLAGWLSPHQHTVIAEEIARLPAGAAVIAAFDADAGGEKLTSALQTLATTAGLASTFQRPIPPTGKDWNDTLRAVEAAYIATLPPLRTSQSNP